jgi:hypothetical protein
MIYYSWFALFAIVAYVIVTDNSVAQAFYMLTQLVRVQYEKVKWWIFHSPDNPITRYLIWRRSMRSAKELMEEFEKKIKSEKSE